ncbi:MAG: c-type cytochrome [Proteobacteria bacterium]|nr:c-type cytochrome [Pseudomonadota bacterium]
MQISQPARGAAGARVTVALGVALLWQSATVVAAVPATRARAAGASVIAEGRSAFRTNCAPCHGLAARGGGRGPDLTSGNWAHGGSDAEIFRTITRGVPGTEMPANALDDSEVRAIIAFLRSQAPPAHPAIGGDPARGRQLFEGSANCATCHMVDGRGGRLGPDLSRVGAARSVAYLVESIREPDKELTAGATDPNNHYGLPQPYDTVTVVTTAGERVVGIARNEDTYSLQLLAVDQSLRCFLKKDLREVVHERKSLMPAYPETALSASQLNDVLAYLVTLGRERRMAAGDRP